ncbi:MAG TPA: regulatory iron-sulfur-containing complex subunit RicT [Syntrophorhabdaceae bacterium]|nr:regulatory iron-sulfur-containing complex subunit RicT [Syntrophorhabdaceae bacterium]HOL05506.1 regulatory iron-sulfur-containing complex subunit RicT [Syntrophorhabdaceae bacterium]HON85453.1 regulatory iron-sulfur-containing complex subunit RicT [Syntrophorhabdaceae bacterium]HOT41426.1 regulatory iron-sulfur-containing complex subunit RicT [Syntrophorhabdaceae bacterium]HPC66885.1 regulatory iron-sulfur-containing complex subunit RicT [Syntrophorhabdaceae bacterium]
MRVSCARFDYLIGVVEVEVPEGVKVGDYVVCELEKGACLGVIVTEPVEAEKEGIKKVGIPSKEELEEYWALKEKEKKAFEICREKIRELNLPMKLLAAEYLFGGSKLLFYFVSENRVDFRELVKELAKEFKIRIELRQVGVRDEAKIIGGLGNCGNICCCKQFLNNFSIVSIRMVKEQGLALNPTKISGICGRLMCCLSYEYDMYMEYKKEFPKVGKKVSLQQGEGKVVKHNTLSSTFVVELENGNLVVASLKDIKN